MGETEALRQAVIVEKPHAIEYGRKYHCTYLDVED